MEEITKSQYFSEKPCREIQSEAPRATIVRRMLKNWPKSIYPIYHPQLPGAASTNHIYKFLRAARRSAAIRKYWTRPKLRLARQTSRIELPRKAFSPSATEGITGAKNAEDWMREIDTLIARSGRIEGGGEREGIGYFTG